MKEFRNGQRYIFLLFSLYFSLWKYINNDILPISFHSRVLITTDVWARGIDVQQVSLVINYDLPNNRELYIHRIGRSGRFGRKGVAINFVKNDDIRILRDIEQYYATQVDEMPMNGQYYFKFWFSRRFFNKTFFFFYFSGCPYLNDGTHLKKKEKLKKLMRHVFILLNFLFHQSRNHLDLNIWECQLTKSFVKNCGGDLTVCQVTFRRWLQSFFLSCMVLNVKTWTHFCKFLKVTSTSQRLGLFA